MPTPIAVVVWLLALAILVWLLVQAARWISREGGIGTTVYDWEHALLYVDGRFERALPSGRYLHLPFPTRRDIYKLRRSDQALATPVADVTSADKFLYRLSAIATYRITDPRAAFENEYADRLRLAVAAALVTLAAGRTLEALLADRAGADVVLRGLIPSPISGCEIVSVGIDAVAVPPEVRRLFVEVERAKLEGLAALERARGEHAALRSLANAAGMLKNNPELMNLRILQAMAAQSKSRLTLVLGDKMLPGSTGSSA